MKIIITTIVLALSVSAQAAPDQEAMTTAACSSYWPEIIRVEDARDICERMLGQLGAVRRSDVAFREKVVFVLKNKDLPGSYLDTAQAMIDIILLRGLAEQPDRWQPTMDIVFKGWTVLGVMPLAIVSALSSAGPNVAHGLDDDGLATLIVTTRHCIRGDSICPRTP
jgi:hypothetical protein